MKQLISILLLLAGITAHAELSMQVDVEKVHPGESFRAVLTKDDASSSGIPDLTSLQADFTIIGTERSTNYSIINGQSSSTSQWTLFLMPKRTGILTIPSIQLGQEKTQALQIEVTSANTNPTSDNEVIDKQKDLMLVANVSSKNPYVNEQVIYTVKLYNSKRLLDASYQGPSVSDALLVPLGEARRYQTTENGQIYMVEEQRYAIFPQKSGKLKITAPEFNALIYRGVPEQVKVTAPETILEVKSAPANYKGNVWAPAKQIILRDEYDRGETTVTEGNTLVRTITLQATGLPAQLLPALPIANGLAFSVYSEKPVESNKLLQNELTGIRTVKITYLFNKAGQAIIPSQELHWFNTVTQKEETVSLPERVITVLASPGSGNSAGAQTNQPVEQNKSPVVVPVSAPGKQTPDFFAWWIAAGFACAWIITLILWWKRPKLFSNKGKKQVLQQLREACFNNQPELARTALLKWASQQWPDATLSNLMDINNLTQDAELKKQITALTKALYQSSPQAWRGEELWRCITAHKRSPLEKHIKMPPLPPINPG